MTLSRPLFAAVIIAGTAPPASAASVLGDAFTFELGTPFGTDPAISGTVGAPGDDIDGADSGGSSVTVEWIDGDTVDINFFGGFSASATDLVTRLADLDFEDGGVTAPVAGVTFGRAGSSIDEFIGDEEPGQPPLSAFVEPVLSFTGTSFAATFAFFDLLLLADRPPLRYDVAIAPDNAPIPLPGGLPLLTGALGLLATRRRRPWVAPVDGTDARA